ncbi:hypothetical protein CAEBREN_12046 [Caenorhabditis brenneri]|uniref:Uncharacterized protein n=1 Tax=Caenorhabditis brenneri TaxID=135651 RepID=G0MJB0_CAEBE|nr:hypothetical protein CAEBREN_12046 [Caenorhabditis brenneri]
MLLIFTPLLFIIPLSTTSPVPGESFGFSREQFWDYIERDQNKDLATTPTPTVNPKELSQWNMKMDALDMTNWSCEHRIFLVTLSVCDGNCNVEGHLPISEEECTPDKLTDKLVIEKCCPDRMKDYVETEEEVEREGLTKVDAQEGIIDMVKDFFGK